MKTSSSSQRHFLQQTIVVSCPVSNALFLLPSLSSSWYTLFRMDHLAGVHIWPDQSGSQMVFFGQVPWEQKGGCKNGYCPVVLWTHEPLLGLSQPVQSFAACFMPPKVLATEMPFEDRAGPLCSDWHLPGQHTDNVSCWKPDSSSLDSFHAHPFQFFSTCFLYSIPLPIVPYLLQPIFFFRVAHILLFLILSFFPPLPFASLHVWAYSQHSLPSVWVRYKSLFSLLHPAENKRVFSFFKDKLLWTGEGRRTPNRLLDRSATPGMLWFGRLNQCVCKCIHHKPWLLQSCTLCVTWNTRTHTLCLAFSWSCVSVS